MAKKKAKKDSEKKAALQAKKEAKADKAALKRLTKESRAPNKGADEDGDDEDERRADASGATTASLDVVLLLEQRYRQPAESATDFAVVESLGPGVFPPARANATLTRADGGKKASELYLFGGEYYDGIENVVLNQLFRYDWSSNKSSSNNNNSNNAVGEWKRILTPAPVPPPRCAHTTVYYNGCLYVVGGELATADVYYHYKDVWKLDCTKLQWSEIGGTSSSAGATSTKLVKKGPSPRSGHVAAVWKNYMIVFGGFYDAAARDAPVWYNDVHVMDLRQEQWLDLPAPSRLSVRPEPRSRCNYALFGTDALLIQGGFSKLVTKKSATSTTATTSGTDTAAPLSETVVHTDAWILHLKPLLQGKPPTWERWMNSSNKPPTGRSGMASTSYNQNKLMLAFGGVVDTERHHHKMDSVFYNDLYALDIERRKWFPIATKASNAKKENGDQKQQQQYDEQATLAKQQEDEVGKQQEEEGRDGDSSDDGDENNDLTEMATAAEGTDANPIEGWDLEKLRSNMFAFIDGSGNLVFEKIEEDEEDRHAKGHKKDADQSEDEEDEEKEETKETEDEQEKEETKDDEEEEEEEEKEESKNDFNRSNKTSKDKTGKKSKKDSVAQPTITASSVMVVDPVTQTPKVVERSEPLPRMKASMMVNGSTLYIYGGLLEVGDREVTLDDFWSLDLKKRERWICHYPGTLHQQVWRGAIHDDDDSYISSTGPQADEESDDDSMSENDDDDAADEKKIQRDSLRQEMAEWNEKYGLSDTTRTPQPQESLAEFYSRTAEHWTQQAAASSAEQETNAKELKRIAFSLARERFEELGPIMARLRKPNDSKKEESKSAKKSSSKEEEGRESAKKSSNSLKKKKTKESNRYT